MKVRRYNKPTSDCSSYISSHIDVHSTLHNVVGKLSFDQVPYDMDGVEGDEQCSPKTYCLHMLQIPLFAHRRDNPYVKEMNKELTRNIDRGTPTFVVDIWTSCAKGLIEVVRMGDQSRDYIALSYCWQAWGERFRREAERSAIARGLDRAPASTVLEEHPALISSVSSSCVDGSGYLKFLELLLHTCNERFVWIDALCIPQYNSNMVKSELGWMGIYYSNSSLCFVILGMEKQIVEDFTDEVTMPRWFTRAWTFQEHMLSSTCVFAIEEEKDDDNNNNNNNAFLVFENSASVYAHLVEACLLRRDASEMTQFEIVSILGVLLLIQNLLSVVKETGFGWELTSIFSEIGNRGCQEINDKLNSVYGLYGINRISSSPNEPLEIVVKKFVRTLPASSVCKLINIDPRSNNFEGMRWFPPISNEINSFVAGLLIENHTFLKDVRVMKYGLSASAPSPIHIGYCDDSELVILPEYGDEFSLVPDKMQQIIHVKSSAGDNCYCCGAITYDVFKMRPCTLLGIVTGKTRIQPKDDKKCGFVITVVTEVRARRYMLQRRRDCKYLQKVGTLMLVLNKCIVDSFTPVTFI